MIEKFECTVLGQASWRPLLIRGADAWLVWRLIVRLRCLSILVLSYLPAAPVDLFCFPPANKRLRHLPLPAMTSKSNETNEEFENPPQRVCEKSAVVDNMYPHQFGFRSAHILLTFLLNF